MDRVGAAGDDAPTLPLGRGRASTHGVAMDRVVGDLLITTASLIDDYVHEQGLCTDCDHEKGTTQ
jgi:hypothetical protein